MVLAPKLTLAPSIMLLVEIMTIHVKTKYDYYLF
jgi:hypothetical protein